MLQFPDWYRARSNTGWFNLCYIPSQEMIDCGVTESEVYCKFLNVLWDASPDALNLERRGVRLRLGDDLWIMFARFGCFLGDDKGHSETLSHRGYSARKPCPMCANVVGRVSQWGPYFVHVHDPSFHRCIPFTVADYDYMAELMANAQQPGVTANKKRRVRDNAWPQV